MKHKYVASLLTVIISQFSYSLGQTSVIVSTEDGQVKGDLQSSIRGSNPYAIFYGVPYAAPPIGPLRFKAPLPVEPWEGVFDNRASMSAVCLQYGVMAMEHASEDCLYLNVATPAVSAGHILNSSLPVMVWIHGGSWVSGSNDPAMYNPDFFMDREVVYVGINYRLGALGFFALESQAYGNQGLRDQNMALQWVQRNIGEFGGDPNQVTIFGQSSGSSSVFYHTISPLSKGLLHRAIAQSGGNLGPGLGNSPKTQDKAFQIGEQLALNAGCFPTASDFDNARLMTCLQDIENGFSILDADKYGSMQAYTNTDEILGEDAFLPKFPRDILESGEMNEVDLIIGVNKDEGLHVIIDLLKDINNVHNFDTIAENWETIGPFMLFDQHEEEITEEVVLLSYNVAHFYLDDPEGEDGGIKNFDKEHIQGIVDMYSDAWYWYTVDDWARLAIQNNLTTYYYMNSFKSAFGLLTLEGIENSSEYGVCHGDELTLLFGGALNSLFPASDRKVSEDLVRWWTNFAKYGNPTPPETEQAEEVSWESRKETGQYLVINTTSYMDLAQTYTERMNFWGDICGTEGCDFGSGVLP